MKKRGKLGGEIFSTFACLLAGPLSRVIKVSLLWVGKQSTHGKNVIMNEKGPLRAKRFTRVTCNSFELVRTPGRTSI